MAPADLTPIDADSQDALVDVKSKKARHFALIVKGVDIQKLIVQKKPVKPNQITVAKQEGAKGDVYRGICVGSGAAIVFEVVSEDGKEPCTVNKLRAFLDEHAGMKTQPEFKLVSEAQLSEVSDDAGGTATGAGGTATGAGGAESESNETESEESNTAGTGDRSKLTAAFNLMTPLVKQALAAQPERKQEVLLRLGEVKRLIEDPQPSAAVDAKTKLLDLGKLLQGLVAGQGNAGGAGSAAGQAVDTGPTSTITGTNSGTTTGMATGTGPSREEANAAAAKNLGLQTGVVKKRTFLITRFQQIPVEIRPHLEDLKQKIAAQVPEEDLDDLVAAIEGALQDFYDEMRDKIDESINAGDPSLLDDLERQVMKNELVNHLMNNPLTDGTPFRAACLDALREVQQALAS